MPNLTVPHISRFMNSTVPIPIDCPFIRSFSCKVPTLFSLSGDSFLFQFLYHLIQRRGVCHQDFEPQNVLRKGRCRLTIVDFAYSDVDHTCPGWRDCYELKGAWHSKLQLVGMLGKVGVKLIMGVRVICGALLFYFLFAWIKLSMILCMVDFPADERTH